MNIQKLFLAGLTGLIMSTASLVSGASATVITHGNLQSDTDGSTITDLVTGREYLRFDEFDLTYADTILAISAGGIYDGWSIADSDIGDDFIIALFADDSNACTVGLTNIYGEICGTLSSWNDGDFGYSYNAGYDDVAYLSTQDTINGHGDWEIGLFYIRHDGLVREYDDWHSIAALDGHNLTNAGRPINLLLYRDGSPDDVPEPGALGFLGLGLLGFAVARRKRRTVRG